MQVLARMKSFSFIKRPAASRTCLGASYSGAGLALPGASLRVGSDRRSPPVSGASGLSLPFLPSFLHGHRRSGEQQGGPNTSLPPTSPPACSRAPRGPRPGGDRGLSRGRPPLPPPQKKSSSAAHESLPVRDLGGARGWPHPATSLTPASCPPFPEPPAAWSCWTYLVGYRVVGARGGCAHIHPSIHPRPELELERAGAGFLGVENQDLFVYWETGFPFVSPAK